MKPAKVKTNNIVKSLKKYAEANGVNIDDLDFKLLSSESLIKTIHVKDFTHYNEKIQNHYDSYEKMINEHVEFKQFYIIEIFKKLDFDILLNYKIKYNDYKTQADIIISPDSIINFDKNRINTLHMLLYSEINKIKAKEGILINLFDDEYRQKLKAVTKHIFEGKFHKPIKLSLIECIEPNITKKSELINKYESKKNKHGISEVEEDEVILEYYKPKFGQNGLDVFGRTVDAKTLNNAKDIDKEIDTDTIKVIEDADKKIYIARVKGYVHETQTRISIDNKIHIQKISRNEEKVTDDENNNIEVILRDHDYTQDSIGEGVELTSETIHVNGFVGANSSLNATNLIIDGATHQTSKQSARFAKINRHKGILRCHNAKIELLEGGEVHATDVTIDTCMSGTVYAKNITIKHVKSNVKIHAASSIKIDLVSGEENLFKIDPKAIPVLSKKIEFIDLEIDDLKYSLEEAKKHKPEKIKLLEIEIEKLKNMKSTIYESVLGARIHIEKPLRGFNTITFVLKDDKKLTYNTSAKKYDDFFLEHTNDKVTLHPTSVSLNLE